MLVYDIEIVKAIPPRTDTERIEGVEYCAGWHDHANMGVAVVCAYDYSDGRFRVFCEDNLDDFADLTLAHDMLIGFNNIEFDDKVLMHASPRLSDALGFRRNALGFLKNDLDSYDILREMWLAAGLGPEFKYPSHAGFGLDATAKANGIMGKTGNGAMAPLDWQQGRIGKVIDYCLNDVAITAGLFDRVLEGKPIVSPKDGRKLEMCPVRLTALARRVLD